MEIRKSVTLAPFYRADGTKVVTKERALGGHAINWHSAIIMGAFGNRLFEPKILLGEFPITTHNHEQRRE